MRAKISLLLVIGILITGSVSANLDFNIRESCNGDEETLFSMYSKSGGNIGEPGHFKWQMCGEGVEESEIKESCDYGETSLISMFKRNDSHASINEEYRWDVCAPLVQTNITRNCETPIASVSSRTDTHLAEPDHFNLKLCAYAFEPENVSVEMKFNADNVYVDDIEAKERSYSPIELSYPYIVSDKPTGLVSYGEMKRLDYETKGSTDIFRMIQSSNSASVLIPHTKGGHSEIEDEEEYMVDRSFSDLNSASFGFPSLDTPQVKSRAKFDYTVRGFEGTHTGQFDLSIRNAINNDNNVEIVLTATG